MRIRSAELSIVLLFLCVGCDEPEQPAPTSTQGADQNPTEVTGARTDQDAGATNVLVQNADAKTGPSTPIGFVTAGSWHGYAWSGTESPSQGTTITLVNPSTPGGPLCASGQVPASVTAVAVVGLNLNQPATGGSGSEGLWTPDGPGITFDVQNIGKAPLTLWILGAAGYPTEYWCSALSSSTGSVAWSQFRTKCWDNSGTAYDGRTPLKSVQLQVSGKASAATPFHFCVNKVEPCASGSVCGSTTGPVEGGGMPQIPGPPPTMVSHPVWLTGRVYTKGYKQENNIYFESDDRGISFEGGPGFQYREKLGKTWSASGTWHVEGGNTLILKPTFNAATSVNLLTSMSTGCRILELSGKGRLFTSTPVAKCPWARSLSTQECKQTGTYTLAMESRSSTSNSSFSSSEATTYTLDPDGFFKHTYSHSTFRCYGSSCKGLSNTSAPTFGGWSVGNAGIKTDSSGTLNLSSYKFAPSTLACPM